MCLVACSDRNANENNEDGSIIDNKDVVDNSTIITNKDGAWKYIAKSMEYLDDGLYINPEWLVINATLDFDFHSYEKTDGVYTTVAAKRAEFSLTIKANISLTDNSKSVALIELRNTYQGAVYLGLYYYSSTTYLNVGGKKYYTEQLNLTSIGELIVEKLKLGSNSTDETDIVAIVGNALQGTLDIGSYSSLVKTVWGILFEAYTVSYSNSYFTYTTLEAGRAREVKVPKYQYINEYLKLDWIMGMICAGQIKVSTFLDQKIAWTAFGLPDLDHLLEDVFGFSLRSIQAKNWPSMACSLHAITEMQQVTYNEGSTGYEYVFNGAGLSIIAADGEFDVAIEITPFVFGVTNDKTTSIVLSSYGLGSAGKGTTYQKGSFTNLEANLQLAVNADENEQLTISSLVVL